MKGSQRILVAILVVVIGGAGAYLYFNKQRQQFPQACLALPQSAVFAYQGQKLNSEFAEFENQDIYKFLHKNPSVAAFENDYLFFDSILKGSNVIIKSLAARPLVVSLHVTTADNFQLLFLHQTENEFDIHDIEKMVKVFYPDERALDHDFENVKVSEILDDKKQPLFACAFMDGIIAMSRNTTLVEEAVKSYHSSKSKNSDLVKQMVSAENQEKVYINYEQLPELLNIYVSPETHSQTEGLKDFASFGVYSWKDEADQIRLNGSLYAGSKSNLVNCLQGQTPKTANIPSILPEGTSVFMDWCADSFAAYFSKYKAYLSDKGKADAWDGEMKGIEMGTGISPLKDIMPAIGTEWGYALLESPEGVHPDELLLIKAADTSKAYESLKKLSKGQSSEYNGYQLNQIRCGSAFKLLLGDLFKSFNTPYFTKVGDFIVFSQNSAALNRCIDAYKDEKSLKKAQFYKSFSKSLISETNFFMYINPERATGYGAGFVKPEYQGKYKDNKLIYRGFNGFAFQLAANGKEFYSQVTLAKPSDKEGNVETAWAISLGASLKGVPHIVKNYESGVNEVMVQDSANVLYLISNTGSILWKRQLDEPVEGGIFTMDLFKNEQSEYLFTTTNKIYLLDHSGKDAGSYPLNLAESTHAGVSSFDFDNNKEYIYLVSCDRGKIYGYNGNGRPLPGWAPKMVDGALAGSVQTFDYNNKHYLFGASQKGTVYLWDITGKAVVSPVSLHSGFKNPFFVSLDTKSIISADSTGDVFHVSFSGAVKKKTYSNFKSRPFFNYIAKDENGKMETVLAGDKTIAGYANDSIEAWKLVTSDNILYSPHIIYFNEKPFIGYVSVAAAKIYLFTGLGQSYPNFPVTGNSDFVTGDLTGNGDTDLIIGGPDKKLYHYKLND